MKFGKRIVTIVVSAEINPPDGVKMTTLVAEVLEHHASDLRDKHLATGKAHGVLKYNQPDYSAEVEWTAEYEEGDPRGT